MNVVLYEPEIPQNTGNIARTCAATGADLYLIEPLGFTLSDKYMKRAGMDYFSMVNMTVLKSFDELLERFPHAICHFTSTKAPRSFTEVKYEENDFIVFGPESRGLPEALLKRVYERCVRIPMREGARSLNLSNSVAIVLYEALRQNNFEGLKRCGALTGREDIFEPWMDYI